jgi:hypothetical protein
MNYNATPEQWARIEDWAKIGAEYSSCLLELRAKVEALEANSKPTPNSSQIGSSLVERVALAISGIEDGSCWDDEAVNWAPEARAAIREVAAWLIDRRRDDDWLAPFEELAELLQEEADQ